MSFFFHFGFSTAHEINKSDQIRPITSYDDKCPWGEVHLHAHCGNLKTRSCELFAHPLARVPTTADVCVALQWPLASNVYSFPTSARIAPAKRTETAKRTRRAAAFHSEKLSDGLLFFARMHYHN